MSAPEEMDSLAQKRATRQLMDSYLKQLGGGVHSSWGIVPVRVKDDGSMGMAIILYDKDKLKPLYAWRVRSKKELQFLLQALEQIGKQVGWL